MQSFPVILWFCLMVPVVWATPLSPSYSSCMSSYSPRASGQSLLNVSSVFANLVPANEATTLGLDGGGHSVLRIDIIGETGSELLGYDNNTNKLATLFTETNTASVSVYSSATWVCNSIFPSTLPTPYYPFNTTYCPIPSGPYALNISIPLYRSYALTTLRTRIRVVDTSFQANTLVCLDMAFTPYKSSWWMYKLFLWLTVALAVGFWAVTWGARFAAGWVVGSGVAEYETKEGGGVGARRVVVGKREARMRKWGTMLVSGLSGERLSVSGGLLRFATPGLRDVIGHVQFCTILAMVAVDWPQFAYPIFAQGAWADLVGNTTLIQGANPASKMVTDYSTNYTPPAEFATMMNDRYYPLYLDSDAFNPLLDMHGATNGISSWAAAVGLREQDLFGTCLVVFLLLTAGVTILSLFLWTLHGLVEYFAARPQSTHRPIPSKRASTASSPRTSLGAKEAYEPRTSGWDASVPNVATQQPLKASAPGKLRRTWLRFRPKGEAGAFHAAALYGNLLRMILMFHLPITTFSMYQLTLGSRASIVSRVFAALSFAFISILIPLGVLFKVYRTPSGKLYDATRTLLSLGPIYNLYVEEKQMFRVFPLAASLITGVVVGAGQKSGLAQALVLVLVELAMLLLPAIWYPWGEGASMGAPSAFLGVIRVASVVLVMLISPTLGMTNSTQDWLTYAVLLLQAIAFITLLLILVSKIIEGLIRLIGGVHFDESTHPLDGGILAAIMDLDCLNGVRGGKAAARRRRKRGSRQLQRNVSAAGSLTTQMMLDRHSLGPARQLAVSEGNTPFLTPFNKVENASASYFPSVAYQPPLGPPPLDRHSSVTRSDEPTHGGNIMDAWKAPNSHSPPYAPPGTYVPSATSPTTHSPPSRTFSMVKGGRADYQNPYDVKVDTYSNAHPTATPPSRALSPPPAIRVSPTKPKHSRQQSSTAIIETSSIHSPSTSPGIYPPNANRMSSGLRANNAGLSPPVLAIPKRRSLNNLNDQDEHSPDSAYSTSTKGKGRRDKGKGKGKGKYTGRGRGGKCNGVGDDDDSESDDEPGPSRGRKRLDSQYPISPSEPGPSFVGGGATKGKGGWRAALGLGKARGVDHGGVGEGIDDFLARDENKARKAALAAESGSLFVGVDAPPVAGGKRGFVVKRRDGGGSGGTPIEMEGLSSGGIGMGEGEERGFKVKRMGGQRTAEVVVPPTPPLPSSSVPGLATSRVSTQNTHGEGPVRSFKVKRPTQHPGSPASPGGHHSQFIVNRPYSGTLTLPSPKVQEQIPADMGYPSNSFVPISEGRSSGEGAPYRPPKNPRRPSEEIYRGVAL